MIKIDSGIPLPNKGTHKDHTRNWRNKNKAKISLAGKQYYIQVGKARMLEKEHGVTKAQYEAQLEEQGHLCAICPTPLKRDKHTHQDHCHATLKPRGILCHNCNLGLGHFRDSIQFLTQAIAYLRKWENYEY